MKVLVFGGLLVAGQAGAECPATITSTGWADEYTYTLTERQGDVAVFESVAGGDPMVAPQTFRMHAGVILLDASGIDGPMIYSWDTPLPSAADLVPGASFTLTGTMSAIEETSVSLTLAVLRQEEIVVASCTYPVLVIDRQLSEDGIPLNPLTVWLHVPSLMPLKQGSNGPDVWEDTAVALR